MSLTEHSEGELDRIGELAPEKLHPTHRVFNAGSG